MRNFKTVVTPIEFNLPEVPAFYIDEFDERRRDEERSIPERCVATCVTTQRSLGTGTVDKNGKHRPCRVETISLFGVQGVDHQPKCPTRNVLDSVIDV